VGQEGHSVIAGVRVVYSAIGEKADAVIKRTISLVRREWIVVSSDRDIANYAWSSGCIPLQAEDFIRALERQESSSSAHVEDDDDVIPHRKGNPRQLSKKEKAIARALSKL
jgi:predicted RNA-binding protein with PIN domain